MAIKDPTINGELSKHTQIITKRYLTSKDAYVTGYFYATIDSVPPGLISFMQENFEGGWTEDKFVEVFTSSVSGVVLPQDSLKTTSMQGKGGLGRTMPLYTQYGNTVNVNFLADQKMEISTLLRAWHMYLTMVSDGRIEVTSNNTSNIYSSNFYYCTLLPNMHDVIYAFAGDGFFPTISVKQDHGHELGSTDSLKHNISFNIEYPIEWSRGDKPNYWLCRFLESRIQQIIVATPISSNIELSSSFGREVPDRFGGTSRKEADDGSVYYKFKPKNDVG
jgi:hypothetical protein